MQAVTSPYFHFVDIFGFGFEVVCVNIMTDRVIFPSDTRGVNWHFCSPRCDDLGQITTSSSSVNLFFHHLQTVGGDVSYFPVPFQAL